MASFSFCSYDSDITDEQWAAIRRLLPRRKRGLRGKTVNMRDVIDAILYVVVNGVKWRSLPNDFPPWQTVYRHFNHMSKEGHWEKIQIALYQKIRKAEGRDIEPSCLAIDSQSIKTGKCAAEGTKGFDGGKRIKGRKRFMATDMLGLIVDAVVTKANEHDTKGGKRLMEKLKSKWKFNKLKKLVADKGFRGEGLSTYMQETFAADVEIGENHTSPDTGFVPAKQRWVVERGFAWFSDYRRLSVDYERLIRNSESMLRLCMIRLMLRRLFPVPCLW